jgi:membrane-bound metal-dependent hydrolase YbcI (DUF457 family)
VLPSGHIAAGYLVSLGAAELLGSQFPPLTEPSLIAFGTFMAFSPDLDMFYKFFRVKRFYFTSETDNPDNTHRHLLSHAPLLYLAVGLLAFLVGWQFGWVLLQSLAILFVLGSWSHFLLDSSGYGIKWLWPFNRKLYTVYPLHERQYDESSFLRYWTNAVKQYLTRPESWLEILIILTAVAVFIIRNLA